MRLRRGPGEDQNQAPLADGSALLQLDAVCASYGSYRALFGISFEVKPGAIVALLGSNGAGKSTVARVVSGLVTANSGRITFNNRDISAMPAFRISRLGMVHVPEGRGIFSSLSVEENLLLSFRQRLPRAGVPGALEQAYTAFPILAERRGQVAGTLSGGQQRILALSRVLATPPRLLIVDELSLGLAPAIIDNVYETLVKIRETGCAVLVVEQQVDRALAIADQAILLARGLVAWSGPASEAAGAMDKVLGGRILDMSHEAAADRTDAAGTDACGADASEEIPKPAMEEVAEALSGHPVADPEQDNGNASYFGPAGGVPLSPDLLNGDARRSQTAPG
jgi:branched-chain amino acid transport system ATP-binding protein